jgi:hypothetical protein
MKIREVVEKLENSKEFKDWKKKNKTHYLVHLFNMYDNQVEGVWQVGYSNRDSKVTTFIIGEKISIIPDEEVFQEKKKQIKELNLDKIKIDLDEALDKAEEFQKKNYDGNTPLKILVVVQNIADNLLYNITYITRAFNTLNMKIDAFNNNMINHEITPMLQFKGKAS